MRKYLEKVSQSLNSIEVDAELRLQNRAHETVDVKSFGFVQVTLQFMAQSEASSRPVSKQISIIAANKSQWSLHLNSFCSTIQLRILISFPSAFCWCTGWYREREPQSRPKTYNSSRRTEMGGRPWICWPSSGLPAALVLGQCSESDARHLEAPALRVEIHLSTQNFGLSLTCVCISADSGCLHRVPFALGVCYRFSVPSTISLDDGGRNPVCSGERRKSIGG